VFHKSLTRYTDGGYENWNAHVSIQSFVSKLAWLHPLPERTALLPHPSLTAELASRMPGKINEVYIHVLTSD
jgi:hypothetical protein